MITITRKSKQVQTVPVIIDGGGQAIAANTERFFHIDYAGEFQAVTCLADDTGSIQVDIYKETYAEYPKAVPVSICASALPAISNAKKNQDNTLTGWTKTFASGSVFRVKVISCTAIKVFALCLKVKK